MVVETSAGAGYVTVESPPASGKVGVPTIAPATVGLKSNRTCLFVPQGETRARDGLGWPAGWDVGFLLNGRGWMWSRARQQAESWKTAHIYRGELRAGFHREHQECAVLRIAAAQSDLR